MKLYIDKKYSNYCIGFNVLVHTIMKIDHNFGNNALHTSLQFVHEEINSYKYG